MPLTQLEEHVALIVVDLQRGIVALPTTDPADEAVARAAQLASAFRDRGLPVVLVNVAGAAAGRTDQEHGYHVVALDAITDLNADSRHHTVTRIFPAIAETTTTTALLDQITARP